MNNNNNNNNNYYNDNSFIEVSVYLVFTTNWGHEKIKII